MTRSIDKPERSGGAIPWSGGLLLVFVCLLWGGNMVSIKFSNQGLPPLLAAAVRSAAAAVCLWGYGRLKGRPVLMPRGLIRHGLIIGLLFGLDFLFLYWGVAFTHASRATIFLYTQPFWVALGAHFFLAGERLNPSKSLGLILAFTGLVAVFGSRVEGLGGRHWIGDLMEVTAALFWAATAVYIKRMALGQKVSHLQTLQAQLIFSVPVLSLASLAFESGAAVRLTVPVVLALAYQTVVVAFFSYLLYFWMVHRYEASRLAAFTFLTPLFGVAASGLVLGEPITLILGLGMSLVAAGIYLVNRPARVRGNGESK